MFSLLDLQSRDEYCTKHTKYSQVGWGSINMARDPYIRQATLNYLKIDRKIVKIVTWDIAIS